MRLRGEGAGRLPWTSTSTCLATKPFLRRLRIASGTLATSRFRRSGSWSVGTVRLDPFFEKAIRAVQIALALAHRGQRAFNGLIALAGDQQLLGGEARDHFRARLRYDQLLLDARRLRAIWRRPVSLKRKNHALLDHVGMLRRDQSADHRLLPDRETDTVPKLQGERRLLVGEAEFLRPRKCLCYLSRRGAGLHPADGIVEVVAAASIGVDQCLRRASNRTRA